MIVLIVSYSAITLFFLKVLYPVKRANPVFWLIVSQWVVASGTFLAADLSQSTDVLYATLFFLALIAFALGGVLGLTVGNVNQRYNQFFLNPVENDVQESRLLVYLTVAFSAFVCLLYYRAIGYNLFFQTIMNTEVLDFKTARLATYSGETYFAPGYVNQFKNVLLPTGLFVSCFWWRNSLPKGLFFALCVIATFTGLFVLLGTGQRGPFVYAFVGLIFGAVIVTKVQLRFLLIGGILLVFLFGLFSVSNGRTNSLSIYSSVAALVERAFVNDQQEGLWGFRYVVTLPNNLFSNWADSILGLLPNRSGSSLDHDLFFRLHNTDRGTSSLSMVGSAYYNGGLLNVVGFYFLLGVFYSYVYIRLLSGRRTILRGVSYGGAIFLLSVFVAGSPVVLLNKGILGFVLLLLLRKVRLSKHHNTSPSQSSRLKESSFT